MWIAVEDRIGRKYGIELKAIYAGRLRPQQLLMSGDVPIVVATGSGALTSHVLGSKDQVIVAINMTKVGGGIFARSEIRSGEDLRGKTIGVSRAGSISEIILRYVLRAKLGLQPDRDVKLLVVGDPAVGLQALERGIVDATPLTMPLPLMAGKMGFRELVNYDALGITFPANTVTTSRQTIGKRPELIEAHGYDTKYAMHVLRLAVQGRELLLEGALTLPIREPARGEIRAVREGQVPFDEVVAHIEEAERALLAAHEATALPDEPDVERVDAWLVSAHLRHWGATSTPAP